MSNQNNNIQLINDTQLSSGEDSRIEYKLFFPESDYKWLKTIVAFLNSGLGGKIYFGINDKGQEEGLVFFTKNDEKAQILKLSKIHFCNNLDNISKCVDRALIYISDQITKHIFPELLSSYYTIEIIKKDPWVICLTIFGSREIIYRLDKSILKNKQSTGVFTRNGSQTAQLLPSEVVILNKSRSQEVNYAYLKSRDKYLEFKKIYQFFKKDYPNYDFFARRFIKENYLYIPKTKNFNYEAYLLSDNNNTKVKINNFSSKLNIDLKPRQLILSSSPILDYIEFLNLFFQDLNKKIQFCQPDILDEIIKNIVLHNDYYHFSNNGPIIEIFDDHIIFNSFQRGGINHLIEKEISAVKYPVIWKLANKIFGDSNVGIKKIQHYYPNAITSDDISVTYRIDFKIAEK
ncbi:ATP-binding protein [Mycoplasma iguanae]|uniref:ATP-binding protein n=1 Tax=Mycoplasma iguanae TaxID=292461 RepID=A0ABY5R9D1_9MOLU|nr:ATP-binding protein [Mycoplasma iguanae]UVD81590.1 ATP-binding protein [Mycoplasma iguanae]